MTHTMLSEAHLKYLDSMPLLDRPIHQQPWWLSIVCACRSAFKGTALVVGRGDGAKFYRFLFAKKSPYQAVFCELQKLEPDHVPLLPEPGMPGVSELIAWQYLFECKRIDSMEAHQVDSDMKSEIYVLPGLVDLGHQVVSDGPLLVLADFVDGLPEIAKKSRGTGLPCPRASQTEEQRAEWRRLVSEYPWLAQKVALVEKSKVAKTSVPVEGEAHDDESGGDPAEELDEAVAGILDDEEIENIFDALAKVRADWKDRFASAALKDFETGILGGASTFRATSSEAKAGVVADYVCCEAHTAAAKSFARSYGLQQSKRASIEKYDVGPATVLTEAWGGPYAVLPRPLHEVWGCCIQVHIG